MFKRSQSKNISEAESTDDLNGRQQSLDKEGEGERTTDLVRQKSRDGRDIIKEGWCEKESGQKILGQYNWRKRWFQLTKKGHVIVFSYYVKSSDDTSLKGEVLLTSEYTARELELGEKSKPNCFALGPLLDSSALRTYYVSCSSEDDKIDWITTLNCLIEGVPEKTLKRKSTYRNKTISQAPSRRATFPPPELNSKGDTFSYLKFSWRVKQWCHLCQIAKDENWKRCETKQGITVGRKSFKDTEIAVIKVESIVPVSRQLIYEFLQRSVKPGGKFDFVFRGESLLQEIKEYQTLTEIVKNDYNVPLPGMKRRDSCMARMWVPDFITQDGTSGILIMSVNHSKGRASKEMERIFLDISGLILQEEESKSEEMQTRITFIVQVDLQNALQNMLRGAYKSGLLKKGIHNGFNHLLNSLLLYKDMLNITDNEMTSS